MQNNMNIKEIERYWGSLEAYNEEQRRVGLAALEMQQLESTGGADFRPNFAVGSKQTDNQRSGFHFFGHKA